MMGGKVELSMLVMVVMCWSSGRADFAKDRQECSEQLVGLATCLPYAQGEGKAPTPDCCAGLKQVLQNSKKCLCILIKDRDNPNLQIKFNVTLALGLPTACHTPANISDCPALLQLPPGSPDAKIFKEAGNSTASATTKNTPAPAPAAGAVSAKANSSSSGSKRRCERVLEVILGVLLILLPSCLTN